MDRQLSPTLFEANFSDGETLTHIAYELSTAREVGFREDWMQRAIARNPELVIAACREAGLTDEAWMYWTREVAVEQAGNIDLLLVSESGRVAIVETKLSYNPEGRRSVIAQTLEYAIHLPAIDASRLPETPKTNGRPFVDIELVQSRIQEGDFLLVIAGDRLDSRAVKLGQSLLGRHLVRGWELALVEIAVFRGASQDDSRRGLLVPHLRGAIVAEQRQVVRIKVEGEKTRIDVESATPVATRVAASNLTEEQFFEKLPSEYQAFAAGLDALRQKHPVVGFRFGKASLIFEVQRKNVLELYLDGKIKFRAWDFERDLGRELALEYLDQLRLLYPRAVQSYTTNDKVDAQRMGLLTTALENLIHRMSPAVA